MKILLLISSLLILSACASDPKLSMHEEHDDVAMNTENDKLCENHRSDFQYFRAAFEKEHTDACGDGCTYTPSMLKNSDTMERVAGLYYLMSCDVNHGRL
ncbi:MAG: hypothetical protein ACU836_12145 [Gammaproteobacteria bacterium]